MPDIKFEFQGLPNPKQNEFLNSDARFTAYGGARGGGKSFAMRRKFLLLAFKYRSLNMLLLRRTLPELEGNHIRPMLAELAPLINAGLVKYNNEKHIFTFPTGSILKLGFCSSDGDVYQYQGQEYDVIGFEEATQFTEFQMEFIKTCNRSVRLDFKPKIYYTCNPGGVGHEYIKRLFIDRNYRRGENPDDYKFIKATVYDNYALMKANPEYVSNLESLPEHLRRAFLNGDWDVVEGQFFSEFSRELHVVDPFPIPLAWKRFRSMDWGFNDPCAVYWHAVAPDRRIYTYKEIYQNQTLAADMAKLILQMDGKDKISYTVASPDTWQKRGLKDAMGGECIADTFCRMKVPLIKADNDRKNGWQRMRENLAIAPDGKPYWQIFSNCTNLIRTIPVAFYDQHDHEDVSANCEDHGIESTRYAMMSRPSPARIKPNAETAAYQYNPLSPPPKRKESGFLNL